MGQRSGEDDQGPTASEVEVRMQLAMSVLVSLFITGRTHAEAVAGLEATCKDMRAFIDDHYTHLTVVPFPGGRHNG